MVDIHLARERGHHGDVDGAIELARTVFGSYLRSREVIWLGVAAGVLVESLLRRGCDADLREARATIARPAAAPVEPGVVIYDAWLLRLRALLAQAEGDTAGYRDQ